MSAPAAEVARKVRVIGTIDSIEELASFVRALEKEQPVVAADPKVQNAIAKLREALYRRRKGAA